MVVHFISTSTFSVEQLPFCFSNKPWEITVFGVCVHAKVTLLVTWLGWQCEAGSRRRRSSCCGRCCSCRLSGRSIWSWSLSSSRPRSGLPAKPARGGAAAESETSSPGGPPRMSGQTGDGRQRWIRNRWKRRRRRRRDGRGGRWRNRCSCRWSRGLRFDTPESLEFIFKMSSTLRGGTQELMIVLCST